MQTHEPRGRRGWWRLIIARGEDTERKEDARSSLSEDATEQPNHTSNESAFWFKNPFAALLEQAGICVALLCQESRVKSQASMTQSIKTHHQSIKAPIKKKTRRESVFEVFSVVAVIIIPDQCRTPPRFNPTIDIPPPSSHSLINGSFRHESPAACVHSAAACRVILRRRVVPPSPPAHLFLTGTPNVQRRQHAFCCGRKHTHTAQDPRPGSIAAGDTVSGEPPAT